MGSCVYGLIDNQTSELFYVGVTVNPEMRMVEHLRRKKSPGSNGFRMEILEMGEDEPFWIEYALSLGCNLTNIMLNRYKLKPKNSGSLPHRLTVDIPPDKGEELNNLLRITGLQKSSFIRLALYREMERMTQERGM